MMVKKRKTSKKKRQRSLLAKAALGLLKSPYYIGKGIYKATRFTKRKTKERRIRKERESKKAKYQEFNLLHSYEGELKDWEYMLTHKDSTIGIILGARGTGKTALGIKILENLYSKTLKRMYAIGFKENDMPSWISVVENMSQVKNHSYVLIDEGGVLFSARRSMSEINKMISDLILIARHKNISILFISQNSANLDVNIIRQADHLIMKPSSLLQKDFERRKIKNVYEEVEHDFKKYKGDKGLTYIYSDEFRGFVSNPLPSFWSTKISKSFSG